MAAVLTGTPVAVVWGTSQNPAGQSITIPADATAVYMFWAFDGVDANGHGLASATLNGNAPAQTLEVPTAAGYYPATGVAAWYNTATGSQTLDVAWDVAPVEGPTCIVAFVKGGDTTAWRDADTGQNVEANAVSVTLTTVAGDLVIKFDQRYDVGNSAPSLSAGWTNGQTQTAQASENARLSYISAAGTTQVCASEDEYYSTIAAISIPGAAAATGGALSITGTATLTGAGASIVSAAASITSSATVTMTGDSSAAAAEDPVHKYDEGIPVAWYADIGFSALYGHQQQGIPIANRADVAEPIVEAGALSVTAASTLTGAGASIVSAAASIASTATVTASGAATAAGDIDADAQAALTFDANTAGTIVSAAASITSFATVTAVGASTNAGAFEADAEAAISLNGAAAVVAAAYVEAEAEAAFASESETQAAIPGGKRPRRKTDPDDDFLMEIAMTLVPMLHSGQLTTLRR